MIDRLLDIEQELLVDQWALEKLIQVGEFENQPIDKINCLKQAVANLKAAQTWIQKSYGKLKAE